MCACVCVCVCVCLKNMLVFLCMCIIQCVLMITFCVGHLFKQVSFNPYLWNMLFISAIFISFLLLVSYMDPVKSAAFATMVATN